MRSKETLGDIRKNYWKRRGKVNYPEKRKKKRVHTQFMSYSRVIEHWVQVPEMLYMFKVDGSFGLYEKCSGIIGADIVVEDEPFRKIWEDNRYSFGDGNAVFAYLAIVESSSMGIYEGRVVYMEHPVQRAARDMSYVLSLKEKYINPHIAYKIW